MDVTGAEDSAAGATSTGLTWSIDREELERWFPGEAGRRQASLRRAVRRALTASCGIGLLLIAGGVRWLPGFRPVPVLIALALGGLAAGVFYLLPRGLFRPAPMHFAVDRDRLTVGARTLPARRIRFVVWGARGDDSSPGVAWLLRRRELPTVVVFPPSVPFADWLLETGPYSEHDSSELHPLDPPLGVGPRLANLIYLVTAPAAAALAWLAVDRYFPGLPPMWALLLLVPLGPGLLVLLGPGRPLLPHNPPLAVALLLFNYLHALGALFFASAFSISRLAG